MQITRTLILATALATFGCRQPLHGADMTNKPLAKQTEKSEDVKPEQRRIDMTPTRAEKDAKEKEIKRIRIKLKEPKELSSPRLEFK